MADPVREVVVSMSEWVPLSVAAERLDCSVVTLKRRIKRGELPTEREARPQGYRLLVQMPDENGVTNGADAQTPSVIHRRVPPWPRSPKL